MIVNLLRLKMMPGDQEILDYLEDHFRVSHTRHSPQNYLKRFNILK